MTITSYGTGAYRSARTDTFVSSRTELEDLQRQLATKQRSETYGGLGIDRRTSLDLNAKIASLDSWLSGIQLADVNVKLMSGAVENFAKMTSETVNDTRSNSYVASSTGLSAPQLLAEEKFKQTLDLLNTNVGGRYLFSGRTSDVEPVAGFSDIMYGDGAGRDGLETLIKERQLADGADGQGRLSSAVAGTTATVTRDAVNAAYGFQLSTPPATTNSAALVVNPIAWPPAGFSVDVVGPPLVGETLRIKLGLPDGTSREITLTARATGTTGDNATTFEIGANPAATAAALGTSISAALSKGAQTELRAASAVYTANDFFSSTSPQRVVTTDYTQPPAADPNRTVAWYKGDDAAGPARQTSTVQVDQSQIVGTGARANEEAFRVGLAGFAVLALEKFKTTDTYPQAGYEALIGRVGEQLGFGGGVQKPAEIITELGSAQNSLAQAKARNDSAKNYLTTTVQGVENVTTEEVAVQILALQNRLQASYQTTSILSKLSLTNYL
jgi:flagellin-like hook-associated protein FlgL